MSAISNSVSSFSSKCDVPASSKCCEHQRRKAQASSTMPRSAPVSTAVMQQPELPSEVLCSVCLSIFIDPVTLLCGHTYCGLCLREFWDRSTVARCPECRAHIPFIPAVNFQLRSLLELSYGQAEQARREERRLAEGIGALPPPTNPEDEAAPLARVHAGGGPEASEGAGREYSHKNYMPRQWPPLTQGQRERKDSFLKQRGPPVRASRRLTLRFGKAEMRKRAFDLGGETSVYDERITDILRRAWRMHAEATANAGESVASGAHAR